MATQQQLAQLSLYVYNSVRLDNRPLLPSGWAVLQYHPDDAIGFSYGVFRNSTTNEVVVSYTGTNEKFVADYALANAPAALGMSSIQAAEAARVAAQTIATYGTNNVTFTGHSLGGGFASIMGVWFDRPATIFDPAPFELLARNSQFVDSTKAYLSGIGLTNSALNSFNSATNFSAREGAVTSYYASEEILQLVRLLLPVVTGTEHRVEFGVDNMLTSRGGLHSQALLTAGLVSDNFRMGTVLVQQSIPLILGEDLYAYDAATSANRNFLIDIIRSDQLIPGNGKLSNFAADLNTLGATVQGLTDAAQKAIVAQAIEWYYWQGTGYAGEDFFATNPSQPSLLQYTTAVGAGLASAENKAAAWANQWLTPIAVAHKAFGGEIAYAQWSVVTGAQGAVATARDATKTQLFIGSTGADVFTGGNVNDKFFAGAGNDSLTGGAGNDQVYGGTGTDTLFGGIGNDSLAGGIGNDSLFGEAGDDTYYYDAGTGNDTITDSDGLGAIFYRPASGTSVMLRGGVRLPGDGAGVFHSYTVNPSTGQITFDSKFTYTVVGADLQIGITGEAGTITIKNFSSGDLRLLLNDQASTPSVIQGTAGSDWAVPGGANLSLQGSANADEIQGLAGLDDIYGNGGDDKLYGGQTVI